MADMTLKKLGFSTDATVLRPLPGQTWILYGAVEIGAAPTLVWTDGTTTEDYITGDQNLRVVAITNEWYLSCVATTALLGWLLTVELGWQSFSFQDA